MTASNEEPAEHDLGGVLRNAGRRSEPPEDVARSVRAAVEAQWREVIAQRTRWRRIGLSLAAAAAFVAVGLWAARPALLGPGEQPWIAASANGPYVVWLSKRGETLRLLRPGAAKPIDLAPHAGDPVVASGPSGRGPVVAVWEDRDSGRFSIQCEILSP